MKRNIYLSMGGNINDVKKTMLSCIKELEKLGSNIITSSFFKTPAWGKTDQPDFINICVKMKTVLDPNTLMKSFLEIEQKYGRLRLEKWGPRTIDIDYLYDEKYVQYYSDILILPHKEMLNRLFVLLPLQEIAPSFYIGNKDINFYIKKLDNFKIC